MVNGYLYEHERLEAIELVKDHKTLENAQITTLIPELKLFFKHDDEKDGNDRYLKQFEIQELLQTGIAKLLAGFQSKVDLKGKSDLKKKETMKKRR